MVACYGFYLTAILVLYSKLSGEVYQRLPSTASVTISGVACDSREPSSCMVEKSISYLFIFF